MIHSKNIFIIVPVIGFTFDSFKNSKTKATVYRFLESQENNIHIAKNNYNEVYWSITRKGKDFI